MSTASLIEEALEFEKTHRSLKSRNDKIVGSKKAKQMVLAINEIYKVTKDEALMDIMKRITVVKRKLEKRLKGPIIV